MIQRFFGEYILAFLPTFGIQSNFVDGFEQIQSLLLLGIGNRRQFELQAIDIRRFGSTGVDGDGFEMFNQGAETIRKIISYKLKEKLYDFKELLCQKQQNQCGTSV